ncbi:MAG: VOC family protein [Candidatus Cloacimonetes bacterium]|nr:VOC family protein [Candidatus Cloacimonadota bacterium]
MKNVLIALLAMLPLIALSLTPQVNIRFITVHVNDLDSVRFFYSDVLGMQEAGYYQAEDMGYVDYTSDGVELQFWRWDDGDLPGNDKWDWQPGAFSGEWHQASWSIHIPDELYHRVIGRILAGGPKTMTPFPSWIEGSAYWSFTVKDPAGNTVEVFTTPSELPTANDNGEIAWE